MSDTKHLQSVILSIAKDIDKLCSDNNIEYYLIGGSALGAKRHNGFIPWDDDFDIALLPEQYENLIKLCKNSLDKNKYQLQEGIVDWPEHFSKIRLKGTHIKEEGEYYINEDYNGIFIDIFPLDYASNSRFRRKIQYFWGKLWLTHNMRQKGYKPNSSIKKILTKIAVILDVTAVKNFVISQYNKYNNKPTGWLSYVLGPTRLHSAFIPIDVFGKPQKVKFEDTSFYAQEKLDEYLKITFGDYMQLPPIEKRVGTHISKIDFGKF